ncbi:hypothetical protein ACWD3I_00505 [Streptomyces sp. NPDC002817]
MSATPGTGVSVAPGIGIEPLPDAPRRLARRREDPYAGRPGPGRKWSSR